ncbi:MAG: hypothetical protein ABFC80_08900 [Coriobacteriales bacterium]|nr:hypothetical protein [Actinomycetes bacterium]
MISQLAANYPGSVWDQLPKGIFNYGGGGVNAWRSICGGPNAGSALLAQLGAPQNVKDEFNAWYEKTALPSEAAYLDYKSGTWTPQGSSGPLTWVDSGTAAGTILAPLANTPKAKPGSLLCHASHGKWLTAAGGSTGYWVHKVAEVQGLTPTAAIGAAGSDRCAKLVYDCVYKVVELINAWKAGTTIPGTLDPETVGCMSASCHGSAAGIEGTPWLAGGKSKCSPCHK